jgi:hypothetical protein
MSSAIATKVDADIEKKLQLVCELFQCKGVNEITIVLVNTAVMATFGKGSALKKKDIVVNGSSWGLEWSGTSGNDSVRYNRSMDLRSKFLNSLSPASDATDAILDVPFSSLTIMSPTATKPTVVPLPKIDTHEDRFGLLAEIYTAAGTNSMTIDALNQAIMRRGVSQAKFVVNKKCIQEVGGNFGFCWDTQNTTGVVVWAGASVPNLQTAVGQTRKAVGASHMLTTPVTRASATISSSKAGSAKSALSVSTTMRHQTDSSFEFVTRNEHEESSVDAKSSIFTHFYKDRSTQSSKQSLSCSLVDEATYMKEKIRGGYLGDLIIENPSNSSPVAVADLTETSILSNKRAFLSVAEPFSLICVGRQGMGKSHTLNVVLENCLINCSDPVELPLTRLDTSMCALVLHFDQSESNVCEALGIHDTAPLVQQLLSAPIDTVKKVIVLASPNFHIQRKRFYNKLENVEVKKLKFRWKSLDAAQLKKLMRLDATDSQLYVSLMLSMLGKFQEKDELPNMEQFFEAFENSCSPEQQRPLKQRLNLLRSIVTEDENDDTSAELATLMGPGVFVICDLTDPMLSELEVNAVFQVMLQQFRRKQLASTGKVVVFDEAHKYLSTDSKSDCLSKDIVATIRQMRHENIRILLSTQSPLHLPAEAIELSTIAVMHEFQSRDWYKYIDSKLSLPETGFETIKNLPRGKALLVSRKIQHSLFDTDEEDRLDSTRVRDAAVIIIRERITKDCGYTITHG